MSHEDRRRELEIRPQPEPLEREAIARALSRTAAVRTAASRRGAWWHGGVAENAREDAPPPRPRR